MTESKTLRVLDQGNLITKLTSGDDPSMPIRAYGPNDKFTAPWYISRFPGSSNICSIISAGQDGIEETVVSMISTVDATKGIEEINEN